MWAFGGDEVMRVIRVLRKETPQRSPPPPPPPFSQARFREKTAAWDVDPLSRHPTCQSLDLGLPSPQNEEKHISVAHKLPSGWYGYGGPAGFFHLATCIQGSSMRLDGSLLSALGKTKKKSVVWIYVPVLSVHL